MKEPGLRILHFPAFDQQPHMLSFVEIVGAKATEHLTPNAVHQGDAVTVWIESLHRLRHADGDAAFGGNERSSSACGDKNSQEKHHYKFLLHECPPLESIFISKAAYKT